MAPISKFLTRNQDGGSVGPLLLLHHDKFHMGPRQCHSYISGVEHVSGDAFVSVPKGDAIFMKWLLHGFSDEHCLKMLKNCREALPSSGKVIIVESILPIAPDNSVSSHIVCEQDILMLAQSTSGNERTQNEYEALAVKAGFSGCAVICRAYNSWVMEFHKRADP
ncbi:hypothetical protein L1049_026919 [Liquidambar formosana]|uniref:O-methyltransferase C-terminal domain-containing protein n=1 Tax=Liquidambar formosana TaxID=63359 RepID=A0AAP0NH98_LIQFO